jgi:hypothetical protein
MRRGAVIAILVILVFVLAVTLLNVYEVLRVERRSAGHMRNEKSKLQLLVRTFERKYPGEYAAAVENTERWHQIHEWLADGVIDMDEYRRFARADGYPPTEQEREEEILRQIEMQNAEARANPPKEGGMIIHSDATAEDGTWIRETFRT